MNRELHDAVLAKVAGARNGAQAAEAAYAEGFAKAAEAAGVDPRGLAIRVAVKEAALAKRADDGTRGIGNSILENAGRYTTVGGAAGIGAAVSRSKVKGGVKGALAAILANIAGRGAAFVTKSRTAGQQLDHDRTLKFRNLVIPGLASFNRAKRLEREKLYKWH